MEHEKQVHFLSERLAYICDIFDGGQKDNIDLLSSKLEEYRKREPELSPQERRSALETLEGLFSFVEKNLEAELKPMDKVRIVRHPQRVCLRDILENVYDNYTEIGGQDEHSIDPAIVIARAYITRKRGNKTVNQSVMVIGHEKGHGQEFRNGGSAKPWGNAKALQYMKVAETENIPVHSYVFTPGAFPIEDTPGAAQQIAANLYGMSSLKVPMITVISEGGSGGAEAVALADKRMMFSHGYYSVISPEGAAAIEGRIRDGDRATPELVERCATQMKITAQDNARMGYVDHVIQEPHLGARPYHYDFFRTLRQELLRATDEVALSVRGFALFRPLALRSRRKRITKGMDFEKAFVRWNLSPSAKVRLVNRRHKKFRKLSRYAAPDKTPFSSRLAGLWQELGWGIYSYFKYDMLHRHQKRISEYIDEVKSEINLVVDRVLWPVRQVISKIKGTPSKVSVETARQLTELSEWDNDKEQRGSGWGLCQPPKPRKTGL